MVIGWVALARGFWHAHMDWLFERVSTDTERFAPDLLDDRDIRVIDRLFPLWVTVSVGVPTALGGLITWSWHNGAPIKEKVSFFGAAGLTVLVTTRQAATAAGIRLSTAAHTRRVLLPLRIIEMADRFDIYPDLPHALRRLGG